jgi:hypothetical protein
LAIVESALVQELEWLRFLASLTFVAVVSVIAVLPLYLALLLPRGAIPAAIVALLLCAIATYAEIPLFNMIENRPGVQLPEPWFFVAMNAAQAVWILAFTGILRMGGYRLTTRRAVASGTA